MSKSHNVSEESGR